MWSAVKHGWDLLILALLVVSFWLGFGAVTLWQAIFRRNK